MFEVVKGRKGNNARNGKCKFPQAQARKERADARKAEYSLLTPEQKLARLDACKLVAKKQRAKLQAAINKATPTPEPKKEHNSKHGKGR